MMSYVAKKTEKIRYKTVALILKNLTPVLYKNIDLSTFCTISFDTRPSIEFMKSYFNKRLIKGVEVGVKRGLNSKRILKKLNIDQLYLIDVWGNYVGTDCLWVDHKANYEYVLKILAKNKKVKIIKNYSEIAVKDFKDNSLDFVYIDANHNYDYVYRDIKLWYLKIKIGGVIAGHDVKDVGVVNAVKDFCLNKNFEFQIENPDWYFIKI